MPSATSILIIRGGAIGDFILTLPAIGLLRENLPAARLEILGYKHIVALAEGRYYADATRSIEYAAMAAFFVPNGELAPDLMAYFASFQQIVSYLYDPNGFFEANLRRAGAKNVLPAFHFIDDSEHAAQQLARPLQRLALYLDDPAPVLHLNGDDAAFADRFLGGDSRPLVAIHPGSGSVRKNWPAARWAEVGANLVEVLGAPRILLVGGEADEVPLATLVQAWPKASVLVARDLPLPRVAACLARCQLFLGHDSGISHLAGAAGVPSVLLFGPTDPAIWAPANRQVRVLRAPDGDLAELDVSVVCAAAREVWEFERLR